MRFSVEHALPGTLASLESLLVDPHTYARLERELPGFERIELLASDETDGVLRRRVRYTPRAHDRVPAFGRGLVTPEMLIWIEESAYDRAQQRIDYTTHPNLPERWRDRFESSGRFTFRQTASGVVRSIAGEINVRVPLVGGLAERVLVREVRAAFDTDANLLASWLA
jgi:hypothetical protein